MKIIKELYKKTINLYDNFTYKTAIVSIGDIMHERYETDVNQFLSATRVLDIENYYKGNKDFIYQNTVSRAAYGVNHRENDGNISFTNLIESCKHNGYNRDSLLIVDNNLRLIDGNHRCGICIFSNNDSIKVKVLKRESKTSLNTDWYYSKGIDTEFINTVLKKLDDIRKNLINKGDCFGCVIDNYDDNLIDDFNNLTNIKNIDKIPTTDNSFYIRFTLKNPEYGFDGNNIISFRTKKLLSILKVRYPDINISVTPNCLIGIDYYNKFFK